MAGRRETVPGGTLDVAVGEPFGVRVTDRAAAGYLWTVTRPDAAVSLGREVVPPAGVGGFADVTYVLALTEPGEHVLGFVESRPWTDAEERHAVTVTAG